MSYITDLVSTYPGTTLALSGIGLLAATCTASVYGFMKGREEVDSIVSTNRSQAQSKDDQIEVLLKALENKKRECAGLRGLVSLTEATLDQERCSHSYGRIDGARRDQLRKLARDDSLKPDDTKNQWSAPLTRVALGTGSDAETAPLKRQLVETLNAYSKESDAVSARIAHLAHLFSESGCGSILDYLPKGSEQQQSVRRALGSHPATAIAERYREEAEGRSRSA